MRILQHITCFIVENRALSYEGLTGVWLVTRKVESILNLGNIQYISIIQILSWRLPEGLS